MIRPHRILAIYRKELIEILRDRRALVAMVAIPVVLYPLLMLWLLWEAESTQERLARETFVVEVRDEESRGRLEQIVRTVREHPASAPADEPASRFAVRVGRTPDAGVGQDVQLRVGLSAVDPAAAVPGRLEVRIDYNETDVRSRAALDEFTRLIGDYRRIVTREALRRLLARGAGPPRADARGGGADLDLILEPVSITTTSTASERQRGGWALGQILPLLLVIMIVSGAIYPAVDLTAGERERGTLETLMAAPVPILHLILGKFLVVATIAMLIAALNLASMAGTMHFGGISRALTARMPIELPLFLLPLILVCMVPLSLLFAAILVAVCSFARTFKEAQHYVAPVIICVLVACVPVSMETARLEGVMLVLPVSNTVLLTRELLQQTCTWPSAIVVLASTTLYAAAAIATAARLFGQEAVLFVDAGSYKNLLRRRLFKPSEGPTVSQALLLAALLFPACFYAQASLMGPLLDRLVAALAWLAGGQFVGLFVLLPIGLCLYLKVDVGETFRLRWPARRFWLAAVLLGASTWALALEFVRWQHRLLPASEAMVEVARRLDAQLGAAPPWLVFVLLALVPGVCEEMLFRGFVLSGLAASLRKGSAIFASAAVFAVFHFMVDRIPLTFLLGVLLAWVCWQSGSLLPGIVCHVLHNGAMLMLPRVPDLARRLGLEAGGSEGAPLPPVVLAGAVVLFLTAMLLLARSGAGGAEAGREGAGPADL